MKKYWENKEAKKNIELLGKQKRKQEMHKLKGLD